MIYFYVFCSGSVATLLLMAFLADRACRKSKAKLEQLRFFSTKHSEALRDYVRAIEASDIAEATKAYERANMLHRRCMQITDQP